MFGHDDDQHKHDDIVQNDNPSVVEPVDDNQDNGAPTLSTDTSLPTVADPTPTDDHPVVNNDLLDIKQHALQQLSPLVHQLDQNPEEKFRTTMMMIQASDDQSLVKVAYEAAQQIQDEKTKAQALLDIVNEINYFTQQHHQD